ncbi:epidermal growth factor receptor kinase substrate 8-like protein 3 [Trichosurus vulpecula]|uniref:epidermal growth factor receptor kinase substrate 8-like protein 3 n=1 Tax=Trichosurus vulpecula TaxID=9337 RepID=UPI00186B03F6|nr:epidermal growth factor receptor kinase substrate 8-like protein 3 [Trichosurus vulpecula]
MDYVSRKDDWSHQELRSALNRSSSIHRPSSKTIYQQRKEYSQTMASEPIILKQRVEHLLTCKLGSETIQEPKDVIKKLQMMDAQGQVWGQDMVLQVKNHWLQILDIETREELDSYPLDGIQFLDAVLNSCSYNSILLIILQELGQPLTSILLFQCWEVGAEILRNNLQKAIDESKGRQESRYRFGDIQPSQNRQEADPLEKYPQNSTEQRLLASYQPRTQEPQVFDQFPLQKAVPERPPDLERDTEELNITLSEIEQFVEMARGIQKNNTKKKKKIWGKKKTPKELPSESQYIECFQKIKHALNLLGKLELYLQEPGAPEFVHILFQALSMVMSNCPNPHLAASVEVPQLTPKTTALLDSCLTLNEMEFWKSLGEFWTASTDYGADQESMNSPHTPRFYGQSESLESSTINHRHNPAKDQDPIPSSPSLSQQPLLMEVQYEFESRNPQELTVAQGEVLEILDQSKQWWLVKNEAGQRGYIPNNILEPLQSNRQRNRGWSSSPTRGPMLRPTSKPQEVRDWLESENFSTITVKSLGMLTGSQLLHMQPRELQLVCPKEAPRILDRLEAVKMMLGPGKRKPHVSHCPGLTQLAAVKQPSPAFTSSLLLPPEDGDLATTA